MAGASSAFPNLTEIRIHGRGGQGNVLAAYVLAQAAFESGRFAQAFPSFGPERRGAPVSAFVRVSDEPVRRRCQVRSPLFLIVQDRSLLHTAGIMEGLLPGGGVLVNSAKSVAELGAAQNGNPIVAIPATALANEVLGAPVPNTALMGAFLSLTNLLPLDALERALARRLRGEQLERNLRLIRQAAGLVAAGSWSELCHARRN